MAGRQEVSRRLDLLGFFCPIPIHETKAAIFSLTAQLESDKTWVLEVVCDDSETLRDIPILCSRMGVDLLEVVENSGEYVFFISNTSDKRKGEVVAG
ncbi:MAG: response regulator SirA [Euryarchaeota archaeon]|nr:response regulator SirA [Euryarchaeota archaeon]|tara:strand:+ start:16370 stop:16660 length:291 start_codon:yes stop_codon:yes gene_type:complete